MHVVVVPDLTLAQKQYDWFLSIFHKKLILDETRFLKNYVQTRRQYPLNYPKNLSFINEFYVFNVFLMVSGLRLGRNLRIN